MNAADWILKGRCYKLGHDVPHAGGVVPNRIIIGRHFDPQEIIPHLFAETDAGFHTRCQPGDIIVTGRNFGMGPKMNGYIAMQALGLGLVCESMPFLGYRAAIGCGVKVMSDCVNVLDICNNGDQLEVDFRNGFFINHTMNIRREYPPIPDGLIETVALGGNSGWLRNWWSNQNKKGSTA